MSLGNDGLSSSLIKSNQTGHEMNVSAWKSLDLDKNCPEGHAAVENSPNDSVHSTVVALSRMFFGGGG